VTGGARISPQLARQKARANAAIVSGPRLQLPRVESLTIPGPAGAIPARLYVPSEHAGDPRPLIVFFHGGGWVIGDLDTHDPVCRFLAVHSGAAVLSIEYRLAPEHPFPAAVEDAMAAFRWAAGGPSELSSDPAKIAVCGDSAGANLSAAVSILTREEAGARPALQALLYPVTDAVGGQESRQLFAEGFLLTAYDMEWFEGHYLQGTNADEDPRASVLRVEDVRNLPPAYVSTAGLDPLRDEAELYAERMRDAGNRVALRRHPSLIHGFANLTAISRSSRLAMHELAAAIRMGLA
jgi:acetyl esterase